MRCSKRPPLRPTIVLRLVGHTRITTFWTSAQVKAVSKAFQYHKLNPNHRKLMDGSSDSRKRRSLLQTPIPPQNGTLYNGERFPCLPCMDDAA